jgi:hypothetical protein
MTQEIRNGSARHPERWMGRANVTESAPYFENVHAQEHFDVRHFAKIARRDQLSDFSCRTIEDVVMILDQDHASFRCPMSQRLHVRVLQRCWLLDNDVCPGAESGHRQREMRSGRRRDVDDIRPRFVKHDTAIGVEAGNAEALGRALGSGTRQVTDANGFDARQLAEASQVLAGNLPSAY